MQKYHTRSISAADTKNGPACQLGRATNISHTHTNTHQPTNQPRQPKATIGWKPQERNHRLGRQAGSPAAGQRHKLVRPPAQRTNWLVSRVKRGEAGRQPGERTVPKRKEPRARD
jgi:hypothetical protein